MGDWCMTSDMKCLIGFIRTMFSSSVSSLYKFTTSVTLRDIKGEMTNKSKTKTFLSTEKDEFY